MIKVNGGHAEVSGTFDGIIIELQVAIEAILKVIKEEIGDHTKDEIEPIKKYILEMAAFALCEKDEQKEILEKWKEGETK